MIKQYSMSVIYQFRMNECKNIDQRIKERQTHTQLVPKLGQRLDTVLLQ